MGKNTKLNILMCAIGFSLFLMGCDSSKKSIEPSPEKFKAGFLKSNDSSLPAPVKKASKSVFKLISQGGEASQTVDLSNQSRLIKIQQSLKNTGNWWEQMQIQYCLKARIQHCTLFKKMGEGTAFLLNDSRSVYTDLHNINEFLSSYLRFKKVPSRREDINRTIIGIPLFMVLTDSANNTIFNSKNEIAGLNMFNPDHALFKSVKYPINHLSRLSDLVELKLEKKLNVPALKIAKEKPKVGDLVYLIGYPNLTPYSKKLGASDPDAATQYISMGKVLSVKEWKERTENGLKSSEVEKLLAENMIYSDFSNEHGNSGGPILNKNGEVVGVFSAMWQDKTMQTEHHIGGGLKTIEKSKIEKLWNKLAE